LDHESNERQHRQIETGARHRSSHQNPGAGGHRARRTSRDGCAVRFATPEEVELARIGREMDKSGVSVEETEELTEAIQEEIRKYRAEIRQRK